MRTARNVFLLLSGPQRRAIFILLVLMLVGMLLETMGIGLIIPILALMTRADIASQYPMVKPWLERLGNPEPQRLVMFGMLVLVAVGTIKAAFLALLAWVQARFVYQVQASFSQRLFAAYLRQPYTFHLQRNTAQLIRNAIHQTGGVGAVIWQYLVLLTEGMVLAGISILLLMLEPVGALIVVITVGMAAFAFARYTRKHLVRWGADQQMHEGMRIQHLQQGLGGAKDVKLLGRESDFLAQYNFHNSGTARVAELQSVLAALPRLWLELLAMLGLAGLVLILLLRGKPIEALLPMVGLFTAAAFRLMPSVNRILGSVQGVRFSAAMTESLLAEFKQVEGVEVVPRGAVLPYHKSLSLRGVSFKYPNSEKLVLQDVSLSIERGTSVGFIGGSGAGKSTLIDIILGLLTPLTGTVKVDGVDTQTNLRGWQDQIGYVPQSIYLTDDTLRRNVAFGLADDVIDDAAVRHALDAAQLTEFVAGLPDGVETLVGERGIRLSGGQRQRIGIARALYHGPPVLVLDEATSSLDAATERGVMNSVRALQGEKTIIIVAHRISTVEHCKRLFRLDQGRVVEEGDTDTVLNNMRVRAG